MDQPRRLRLLVLGLLWLFSTVAAATDSAEVRDNTTAATGFLLGSGLITWNASSRCNQLKLQLKVCYPEDHPATSRTCPNQDPQLITGIYSSKNNKGKLQGYYNDLTSRSIQTVGGGYHLKGTVFEKDTGSNNADNVDLTWQIWCGKPPT